VESINQALAKPLQIDILAVFVFRSVFGVFLVVCVQLHLEGGEDFPVLFHLHLPLLLKLLLYHLDVFATLLHKLPLPFDFLLLQLVCAPV